jgi:WD40 repeat protein
VEVVVSKGGKVVKIIDTKSGKHVTLKSADYELALKDGQKGLRLSPVKMTVKRGETVLATIERVMIDSGLIKNGGFEAGIEGWTTWSHGPPSQFEFDRDVVREGRQSLRVTASDPADCGCWQLVDLKPRQWYHFSGWVRTRGLKVHGAFRRDSPLGWGTIIIQRLDRPGEGPEATILARGDNHSGDTEWTRISLRFQAPDDGKARISVSPASWARVTGTAWFDGLKLVEESPPPSEKVGEVRKFVGHTGDAHWVAYSRDGRYAVSCSGWPIGDGTIRLWDVSTGKQIRQFNSLAGQVLCVTFSPDGRRVLYGTNDHAVILLDVATGKEVRRFVGCGSVYTVTFSPNGRQVLSASADGAARVWDADTGKELCKFEGHRDRVMEAVFSPDGKRALSGAMDKTIYLWDVKTGEKVQSFEGHTGGVHTGLTHQFRRLGENGVVG